MKMAGRSWRPLPIPLDQTEVGQGSWRQRISSSSNPASVGAPKKSEIWGTAGTGRGSDYDDVAGDGGGSGNGCSSNGVGVGVGGSGGGISVRDLLSS